MSDSSAASSPDASASQQPRAFRIGAEFHKRAFCSLLTDDFAEAKPTTLPWPNLSEETLRRFVELPFWDVALETEGFATCRTQALADRQRDPLIKKALGISAYEAGRLKIILRNMLNIYGIALPPERPYGSRGNPEWLFLQSGCGKCFDSFLAFGLFKRAKETGYLPPEMLDLLEPLLQEQARYSLFFVNWLAYKRANLGLLEDILLRWQTVGAFLVVANARTPLLRMLGGSAREVLQAAMAESERRLAVYNPLLPRPKMMLFFVKLALKFMKA
jgi:hypothetical protein